MLTYQQIKERYPYLICLPTDTYIIIKIKCEIIDELFRGGQYETTSPYNL